MVNKRRGQNRREDSRNRAGGGRSNNSMGQRKPPRTAVVAIRTRNDNISYAEILKKARQEISLGEIGIEVTRIRREINGSIMIEIPEQESSEKANTLAIN